MTAKPKPAPDGSLWDAKATAQASQGEAATKKGVALTPIWNDRNPNHFRKIERDARCIVGANARQFYAWVQWYCPGSKTQCLLVRWEERANPRADRHIFNASDVRLVERH